MEKKLPDDQLEDFLRNSFKDYSEKPSEDVWDKIDYSLDHQSKKVPSNKKWIWMLSAAAMTGLILYLGATNIYLNYKLRKAIEFNKTIALNHKKQVDQPDIKSILPEQNDGTNNKTELNKESNPILPDMSAVSNLPADRQDREGDGSKQVATGSIAKKKDSMVTASVETLQKVNSSKILTPAGLPTTALQALSSDKKTKNQIVPSDQARTELKNIPSAGKQSNKSNTKHIELVNNNKIKSLTNRINGSINQKDKDIKTNIARRAVQSAAEIAELNETNSIKISDKTMTEMNTSSEKIDGVKEEYVTDRVSIDLVNLPLKATTPTSLANARTIHPGEFATIIPVKIPLSNHWSELNIQGGIIQESGTLTDLRRNNFPLAIPSENTFTTTNSWSAGLGFSKSLYKNWYVSTGLAFKKYELLNTINQNLIFGGRINPGSGSTPFHHDWNFKLNCPGGTSNIMIQSEQLDSRATISDNEQVKVTITNKEKLNYLSIPVALNYRATLGKVSLIAGAGLHMNILTRSSFEEPTIQIKHPQLKARTDPHNRYRFDKSNAVVWNSTLSAGLAYAIAPKISLQLMPSWFIPFTNRNSDRDVKVNSTSFAFQVGLNYSFASL